MGPSLDKGRGKGNGPGFVSNTGMEHPQNDPQAAHGSDTDQRLTELEIKASFAEDLLDQLDKIIVRQQQQIDALLREVADLKAAPVRDGDITAARSLRDELPPHF
jgi:SlyX protein